MTRAPRIAAILLFAAVVVIGFLMPGRQAAELDESAVSTRDGGRRAAWLLLADLGFEVAEWRQPPNTLPPGGALLVMPHAPVESERRGAREEADSGDALERAVARGGHALHHYREFVERGGALLIADGEGERAFLSEGLGIDVVDRYEFEADRDDTYELAGWVGDAEGVPDESGAEVLLTAADGTPLAWRFPLGAGSVTWLASDRFLRNDELGADEHARLFVRMVERLAGDRPVWFDEYAVGRWQPGSVFQLATGPRLWPLSLHLLLLGVLWAWRRSWVADFPRDLPELERISPLARAEALASLCLRARREALLGRWLRDGVWRRILERARLPSKEGGTAPDAAAIERVHASLAARGSTRATAAAWRAALVDQDCTDGGELERVAAELGHLEREIELAER